MIWVEFDVNGRSEKRGVICFMTITETFTTRYLIRNVHKNTYVKIKYQNTAKNENCVYGKRRLSWYWNKLLLTIFKWWRQIYWFHVMFSRHYVGTTLHRSLLLSWYFYSKTVQKINTIQSFIYIVRIDNVSTCWKSKINLNCLANFFECTCF